MPTNTADIRQYLTSSYSDEELITLCADYFRDVYDNFAVGMTKTAKIQLLLDHCQRRELMPNLLVALERDRPEQYRKRFGQAVVEPAPAATPQGRDPRLVFISHAHEDAEFAHRLAADLGARGWRVWIAPDSIRPGEKWVDAINRGLEACGVFLVALTPAAVASKWVTDETNVAKEMHQEGELRFIPLGVVDCRVPPLWRVHQRIPFKQDIYATGLAALLTELESVSGQSEVQRPAPPAAEAETRMMEAITEGLRKVRDDGGDPRELIAMRFIEALEKMAEDPATKVFFPSDMRLADVQGLIGAPARTFHNTHGQNELTPVASDNPAGRE